MIDYIELLEQEPEIRDQVLEILLKTIVADNPQIVDYIYSMLNVGISKDQIIEVMKHQIRSNKSDEIAG